MSYEQQRQRRRLRAAKHEGGHALVLLVLGLPFKNVEIQPHKITMDTPNLGFVIDHDEVVAGVVRMDAVAWFNGRCRMSADDRIMQAMAGMAGEQIDWKRSNFKRADWKDAGRGDMADAKHTSKITRLKIEPEFYRASVVLQMYRSAHTALVDALMEKSILSYAECVAIWEANRG
jgi:hypothetical protein